jgi:hypothetical protein
MVGLPTDWTSARTLPQTQGDHRTVPPNNRLQATAGGLGGAGPARWAFARRA